MFGYTLDLAVAHLNAILVVVVLLANLYALLNGNPARRWIYAMTSVLAVIFVGSYLVLLGDFPARILEWSRIMRGVSLVAWVVVWIIPPLYDVRLYHQRKAAVDALEASVCARLNKDVA